MIDMLIAVAIGAGAFAAMLWFFGEGVRQGDRPDDARVRAVVRPSGQPEEDRPVAVVTVVNCGSAPALVAVGVRAARLPGLLAETASVTVPRRTARRAFRPDGYPTVAVVASGEQADLTAPVRASARRYLVTVLVGQPGRRLRVHRLRTDDARCVPRRVAVSAEQGRRR